MNPSGVTIEVLVNGEPLRLPEGASVGDVLRRVLAPAVEQAEEKGGADLPKGVAVALGENVVPAGQWTTTRLRQGDRLEVLGAVAGG